MVVVWFILNYSSTYCVSSELFPTQLSPIISSFTRISYFAPLIRHLYNVKLPFHQDIIRSFFIICYRSPASYYLVPDIEQKSLNRWQGFSIMGFIVN
jgi:hypothetical protein